MFNSYSPVIIVNKLRFSCAHDMLYIEIFLFFMTKPTFILTPIFLFCGIVVSCLCFSWMPDLPGSLWVG